MSEGLFEIGELENVKIFEPKAILQPSQLKRLVIQQKFELEGGKNQKRILSTHKSPNESKNELPHKREVFKSF